MTAQQAGAVPYRRTHGPLELCLITTASAGKWSIPKGFIDPGDTARETVAREAWEEAGLHGQVVGDTVGYYEVTKFGTVFTVAVYLFEVERVDDAWEEQAIRQRRWATPAEATRLLEGRPVSGVVGRALTLLEAARSPDA